MGKTYKGREAVDKLIEKLSQFGTYEVPLYPFKAGKIWFSNLTKDLGKYGGYIHSKHDKEILAKTVGEPWTLRELGAFLRAHCGIEHLDDLPWPDIIAALELCIDEGYVKPKREQRKRPQVEKALLVVLEQGSRDELVRRVNDKLESWRQRRGATNENVKRALTRIKKDRAEAKKHRH